MDKLRKTIITNLRKEGAKKISLFGSYARKQHNRKSDVDILVEFKKNKSLLNIVRIERELSKETGIKVDLLTKNSVSPLIMDNIKKDMKVIYG